MGVGVLVGVAVGRITRVPTGVIETPKVGVGVAVAMGNTRVGVKFTICERAGEENPQIKREAKRNGVGVDFVFIPCTFHPKGYCRLFKKSKRGKETLQPPLIID